MTLESRLIAAFEAVGADVKALQGAQGGSGGQVMPVGGITWMHPEFIPDEFTDNAQRFIRTGTAVTFEPGGKHDEALAAGFGLYDYVKKVGYADSVYLNGSITCVDNVSGSLTPVKDKVVFTPWFNSSGVGVIEFQQHPEVSTYSHSYCWSPVLQTWLVGYVKPTVLGARELCVYRLSGGKWVETYRSDSGTPANSAYYPYSFACSSQDTAIFEFTLNNNVRYELVIALDTNGVVIGKVFKSELSVKSNYRRWFAGKDGYVIARSTTASPTVSDFLRTAAETVRQDAVTYKTTMQLTLLLGAGNASNMQAVYHEGVWVLLYGKTNPNYRHTVVTGTSGVMGYFSEQINLTSTSANISSLAFTESGWVGYNSDSSNYQQIFITSSNGVSWSTKSRVGSTSSPLNPFFKDNFIATDGVYPYTGYGVARTPSSFDFKGMAANDYGQVFAFSNGVIGFIPHDRQYHLMDLVYTYNTTTSNTTLCKTVNGQFFVYMTGVGLLTSTNGMTWTVLATGLAGAIHDVEYLSGTYVVAGNTSGGLNFAYSTDSLASWTKGYIRTTNTNVFRLLNTGERLVALCSTGAAYTETGTAWSNSSGGNFYNAQRTGLVHDGVIDVFVYSNATTVVQWRSVNGGATFTNVKTVTLPYLATSNTNFLDMCIRKGKWWALYGDFVYSSSDGNSWSPEPLVDTPISNPYPQLIEMNGELRFMTNYASWVVLDSDSNVPALVGTKLEVVQESGAVGFIRIE